MKYRKLRIACSAVCGIICVLLILLWARSYWTYDSIEGHAIEEIRADGWRHSSSVTVESWKGVLGFHWSGGTISRAEESFPWKWLSFDANSIEPRRAWDFHFSHGSWVEARLKAPHWCAVFATIIIATLPWLRWRFSLRSLLIAMTLVALTLGAVIYAAR